MSALSKQLYDLQDVESKIDAAKGRRNSITQKITSSSEIAQAEAAIQQLQARLAETERNLRRVDVEASEAGSKSDRLTKVLYGGAVHDSREMASLEAEIGHAKSERNRLEDSELELMEMQEAFQRELGEAAQHLEELRKIRENALPQLNRDLEETDHTLRQLEADHAVQESAVDPRILTTYRTLKDRLSHAVSMVQEGTCQWCRVQVPPKDVQHAREQDMVRCSTCGRILHVE